MNLWRVYMYVATAGAAAWFVLGILSGDPRVAVGVVGHGVLAYLCWRLS